MQDLVKQLFRSGPVFEQGEATVFGDPSTINFVSLLKKRKPAYEDPLARYETFVSWLKSKGYSIEEVDSNATDGYKGKHIGKRLMVYKDLDTVDKTVVLAHEYNEARMMEKTGIPDYQLHPAVQRQDEEMLGPGGEFDFPAAYAACIDAGKRTGMRK